MGDNHPAGMPQRPAGFQGPGVPGSGTLLDPAVRGDLREQLQPAARGAADQLRGGSPETDSPAAPTPHPHQAGPHPHGDVDLSFISANVPAEPVKPRRGRAGRRFYFLPDAAPTTQAETPTPTTPPGPKPG